MDRFDKNFVEIISRGDSIILVGSGASVGAGYPTWGELVKIVYSGIVNRCDEEAKKRYNNIWAENDSSKFLKFFDFAVEKFGKTNIVNLIKEAFNAIQPIHSELYAIITKWPINVYLTTNYDSEIKKYLDKTKQAFTEKGNSDEDLITLNDSARNYIYKIHGEFSTPKRLILTEKDYKNVLNSNDFNVWREKINALLHMKNVVLIGYSATDPDFKQQLLRAKEIASPSSPVYMFATGLSNEQIDELFIKENIRVIEYDNPDNRHSQLTKLLKQYDAFIPKRGERLVGKTSEQFYDAEIASAIFLYNEIYFINGDDRIISKAFSNCILNILKEKKLNQQDIVKKLEEQKISADQQNIILSINNLKHDGYVSEENNHYFLSEQGLEFINSNKLKIEEFKIKFIEYCKLQLKQMQASADEIKKLIFEIHKSLEILFQKRGLEIARKVLTDDIYDINLGVDIAEAFSSSFSNLNQKEYGHFIDLVIDIIQIPSQDVRNYFALLCNGYFIYNILGHDKNARDSRLEILKNKKIYIDSSVLISLMASSCQSNKFSLDLLKLLRKYNNDLWITENLYKELYDHAYWAIQNFSNSSMDNINLYQAYTGYGNYKQNLFIDGAYNAFQKERFQYMDTYLSDCFGEEYSTDLDKCLKERLEMLGISIRIKAAEINISDEAIKQEFTEKIKENRINNDSFRSDFQCQTEAELLALAQKEPFCFITHTNNLKKIDERKKISNWSPEGLYRFLSMNDCSLDLDNLYNCMVSDIYTCGFHVINKETMERIAEKFYIQADLQINEIQKRGNKFINAHLEKGLIDSAKADGSYPFFAMQMQSKFLKDISYESDLLIKRKSQLDKQQKVVELSEQERKRLARYDSKKAEKIAKEKRKRIRKKKKNKKKR